MNDLDSKFVLEEGSDLSEIKSDLAEWEAKLNKLYYDKDLCKKINEFLLGQQKKFEFGTKYCNIFNTFYNHIGLNTYI